MNVKVVVSVCDKYNWSLRPFSYLFNKYWSELQDVVVAGYTPPNFSLPSNFKFVSIDTPSYPKERWVDGFMKFLEPIDVDLFVLLLEDYYICRRVDNTGIATLADLMNHNRDIIRVDLTADRLYAGGMKDVGYYGHYDLVEAKNSPYQMSLQAGIWNKRLLLDVLGRLNRDQHSSWDVELEGTTILNKLPYRVLGTRQFLIRYSNGVNNSLGVNKELNELTDEDRDIVLRMIGEKK